MNKKVYKMMPNITCPHKILNLNKSSKNIKFKKKYSEFYDGRTFSGYHSHFLAMNISISQTCLTKKTSLVYSASPHAIGV